MSIDPILAGLTPSLISAVHTALCTMVGESENERLGDQLPRDALRFFLRACLNPITSTEFHDDVVLEQVNAHVDFIMHGETVVTQYS